MIKKIAKIEKYIGGIFLLLIIILGFFQVVFRFLGMPIAWSEEASLFCFVWFAYMGAAACTLEKKHIRVEFLLDRLPNKIGVCINIAINFLWIIICVVIGIAGFKLMLFALGRHSVTVGGRFPYWVAMASVGVGMLLMGIGVIINTVNLIREGGSDKE